jgi:tripartite ATP-independent transporter DctP family solute receptor
MNRSMSFYVAGVTTGLLGACVLGAFVIRPEGTGGASAGLGDRAIVLKLAHGLDKSHPVHQGMEYMKTRLEELTGEKASIDLYSGGVLGSETDCLEQVQKGELAMTKVSAAALEAFLPEMKVFSVPFAFRDADHFWNTLHSPIGKRMLGMGVERQFRGLCYYDSGDRNFYTTKKPVRSVADIQGMKVRVMNSRTAMDMINAMGGSPCPISWGELYTALAQGTVDGAENNAPSFMTSRHYEVCKYFILTGHQRIPDMLIISTKAWDKLPLDIRKALQQAADESETYQRKLWKEMTDANMVTMQEKGVEIVTPDLESFRKVCAPITEGKDYLVIQKVLSEIREVK